MLFRGPGVITVAVQFDERLPSLARLARMLARLTGARLRLAHVSDPWTKSYLATAVEGGAAELVGALSADLLRVAHQRLTAAARVYLREENAELALLKGDVVGALAADVEASGTGLLAVGATRGGAGSGFSTAVSLIGEVPVPVLVLNEAAAAASGGFGAGDGGLTLVVADDLSDAASGALAFASALARAVPGTTLVHAHVETHAELVGLRRPRRGGAGTGVELTPNRLTAERRQAEERLRQRAGAAPRDIEAAGGRYEAEVMTGAVVDEIERTAAAYAADLVVFGQHRVFHRQTMLAGQVPFKSMLALARPVVVVPPTAAAGGAP